MDLLDAIVKTSDVPIKYSVNDYAVVFSLRDTNEPPPLEIRTFHLNADAFFRKIGVPLTNDARTGLKYPPLAESDHFHRAIIEFFNSTGADFDTNRPANRTKTFSYTSRHSLMAVRATHNDLQWIENALNQLHLAAPMESQTKPPLADLEAAVSRANLVYTSKGRQAILAKLDKIHLDEIHYDGIRLGDLINDLSHRVKALDTNSTGINFFISRESFPFGPAAFRTGEIDPATGLPILARPNDANDFDMSAVTVNVNPALYNVRLADVLDAITRTANRPIRYSILDYAVVFSPRTPQPIPLEIRTFHVDPNTFRSGLESVINITTNSGSGAGIRFVTSTSNSTDALQVSIREFFGAVGVDFNTNNPANIGKAFAWSQRKGVLTVRATASDLDMLAAAIENLNAQPLQINLKVKIVEVIQNDNRALGFNWTLGNFTIGSNVVGSGGTQILNSAGQIVTNTTTPPSASNGVLTGNSLLRNPLNVPTLGTISGILTAPQYQVALQALDQRGGVNTLFTPEVTGISGHEAHIQAMDLRTNNAAANLGTYLALALDIVPTVSADERSLQLNVTATVPEFLGYVDPGKFEPNGTGNPTVVSTTPLPHYRVRQITSDFTIADGQTVVLAGVISTVPEKGSSSSKTNAPAQRKNTMIFITPTLVNPDGTPYHTNEQRALQTTTVAPAAFPGPCRSSRLPNNRCASRRWRSLLDVGRFLPILLS